MPLIRFTKMHGAGNDFIVIDGYRRHPGVADLLTPARLQAMADRQRGIGADQILLVEPPQQPENDFRYRIFNADGQEVEQCGNGARCFARFVADAGLTTASYFRVETKAGVITPRLLPDGMVAVDMGPPRLGPEAVGFNKEGLDVNRFGDMDHYGISLEDGSIARLTLVSMGNPHAVMLTEDVDESNLGHFFYRYGPFLEKHRCFAHGANIGLMAVMGLHHAKLRVWERGSGETLACGTGACAAAVAGIQMGLLQSPVTISLPGGNLTISWAGGDAAVMMSGPAQTVFTGEIEL